MTKIESLDFAFPEFAASLRGSEFNWKCSLADGFIIEHLLSAKHRFKFGIGVPEKKIKKELSLIRDNFIEDNGRVETRLS
jgi:hypothetical protein